MYGPYLGDLAGQLWSQVVQVHRRLSIICNPHQVSVDKDDKVMPCSMARTTKTDERCRDKL